MKDYTNGERLETVLKPDAVEDASKKEQLKEKSKGIKRLIKGMFNGI